MLKKTALIALAVVLLVGAGVASVRHYHKYQNYKNHALAVAAQKSAEQAASDRKAEELRQQAFITGYNRVVAECQKGVATYAQLTPAQKAKTSVPVCGDPILQ